MPSQRKTLVQFTEWFLRIAIIIYCFSFLYNVNNDLSLENNFWDGFVKIVLLLIFIILLVILISISRSNFETFGFFLVFIGTLYNIFQIIFVKGFSSEIALHFLLISVSFYFLTKPIRSKKKQITTF